jgi:hypothetical protein
MSQDMTGKEMVRSSGIQSRIYSIRGLQVMLDSDLAKLYCIEVKVLNQAVKRNSERFPTGFMFQLTTQETENLKSQIVTSSWGGRFIVIDGNVVYHFGASLKDLGKKWFAFSKMDIGALEMLGKLENV